jgi:hypothetical protein
MHREFDDLNAAFGHDHRFDILAVLLPVMDGAVQFLPREATASNLSWPFVRRRFHQVAVTQTVSDSGLGYDELRSCWIDFDLLSQFRQMHAYVVGHIFVLVAPDRTDSCVVRDTRINHRI